MQAYTSDAPMVEVQQDQHIDQTLVQLQQDLQEQLQQQINDNKQQQAADAAAAASSNSNDTTPTLGLTAAPAGAEEMPPAPGTDVAQQDGFTADAAAAAAATASRAGSVTSDKSGCEDEWQMVSPHCSVRLPSSSSGRCSFECAGMASPTALEAASTCGSDTTSTPKDELAESILGNSVLMAAAAAAAAAVQQQQQAELGFGDVAMMGSDDGMDAVRAANSFSSEASLNGLQEHAPPPPPPAAAAADVDPATAPAPAAELAPACSGSAASLTSAAPAAAGSADADDVVEILTGLGLLSGQAGELVGGLREWIMESLAALVQTGRSSHAACLSSVQSIQRSFQLAAKQGGLAAAAVGAAADWRVVLSSAAAVVCLAMWLKTRNEAAALRTMLRRRDHELTKLVMRVVSLQELLNQGSALPITRYMSYSAGATAAASFM